MPGEQSPQDPNMTDGSVGAPDDLAKKAEIGSNIDLQQAAVDASRRVVDEREREQQEQLSRPLAPGSITEVPGFAAKEKILQGERETGAYMTNDGKRVVSEITPDGMKQTRNFGGGITKEQYQKQTEDKEREAERYRKARENQDPEYLKQFMRPENAQDSIKIDKIIPNTEKMITEVPGFEQTQKPD